MFCIKVMILAFMFGILVLCVAGVASSSWIINGANKAEGSCKDDPGLEEAHKRSAWSISIYIFAGIAAIILAAVFMIIPIV